MSLTFTELSNSQKRYDDLKERIVKLIGYEALNSNHYGATMLFNEAITEETSDSKILEIWNNYKNLINDIENIFIKNAVPFLDGFITMDYMYGIIKFLNEKIDVYSGITDLLPAINEYINLYKKVKLISNKYKNIPELILLNSENPKTYFLFNKNITSDTSEIEINNFLSDYDQLNKRTNQLLKLCNFHKINCVSWYNGFYLFDTLIDLDVSNETLAKIINRVISFENNIKLLLLDLKISDTYRIEYNPNACIYFGGCGSFVSVDSTYQDLKKEFEEWSRWHEFNIVS